LKIDSPEHGVVRLIQRPDRKSLEFYNGQAVKQTSYLYLASDSGIMDPRVWAVDTQSTCLKGKVKNLASLQEAMEI